MTIGERRATRNLLGGRGRMKLPQIETMLLLRRSQKNGDIIAAMIDEKATAKDIARIARRALSGDRAAESVFIQFRRPTSGNSGASALSFRRR